MLCPPLKDDKQGLQVNAMAVPCVILLVAKSLSLRQFNYVYLIDVQTCIFPSLQPVILLVASSFPVPTMH